MPQDLGSHKFGSFHGDRLAQLALEATGTIVHDAETPDVYSRFIVTVGAKMGEEVSARGIDVGTTATSLDTLAEVGYAF